MLSSAVYLLLVRDNKVFLLRRFNTGWSDGLYTLPAGHIDGNESLTAAMCREALEETGVTIEAKDLQFVHAMHRQSNVEYLDFFFTATKWQGEPYNAEPEKSDDAGWFPLDQLPENTLPYVKQVIADYQQGRYYSEIGW